MAHLIDTSLLIRQADTHSPDPPGIYDQWVLLVNHFGVSGKPSHDARIAATMLLHRITHILTFNVQDFQRFAPVGIFAVDPANVP